ncbi:hypothetical protein Ahia01_000805400 [Argonauta hians]
MLPVSVPTFKVGRLEESLVQTLPVPLDTRGQLGSRLLHCLQKLVGVERPQSGRGLQWHHVTWLLFIKLPWKLRHHNMSCINCLSSAYHTSVG